MKKITLFIIILFFSLLNFSCTRFLDPLTNATAVTTMNSTGSTYFIDASGGNDANNGLTEGVDPIVWTA